MAIFVFDLLLNFGKKRFTDKAGVTGLISFSTIIKKSDVKRASQHFFNLVNVKWQTILFSYAVSQQKVDNLGEGLAPFGEKLKSFFNDQRFFFIKLDGFGITIVFIARRSFVGPDTKF